MPESSPTVLVIDDDPDLRDSLGVLLRSAGLATELYRVYSRLSSVKTSRRCCLPCARCKAARGKRSGISAGAGRSQYQAPDHFYYRIRRCADVGTGDEGWRR